MVQPYSAMGSVLVILGRGDQFMLVPTVTKKQTPQITKISYLIYTDSLLTVLCIFIMCVNVQWAGPHFFPGHSCMISNGLPISQWKAAWNVVVFITITFVLEEREARYVQQITVWGNWGRGHGASLSEPSGMCWWVTCQSRFRGTRQPILLNTVFEVLRGQASPWRVCTWTHIPVNKVEPLGLSWAENQDMPPCPVLRSRLLQPRGGEPFPHLCSFLPFISPLSYAIPLVLTISCSPGWTSLVFLGVVRHSCS